MIKLINAKPIEPEEWEPAEQRIEEIEDISPSMTYRQDVWLRFKANKAAMAGAVTIIFLILAAIFGPYFSKHSYDDQILPFANVPPIIKIYKIGSKHFLYLHRNLKLLEVSEKGLLLSLIPKKKEDSIKKKIFYNIKGTRITIDYKRKPAILLDADNNPIKMYKKTLNRGYPLGTDSLGRDLFVRVLYGTRISLLVALIATLANFIIGVLYGGLAGISGGKVDNIMMRIVDIINTIPLTLYVILIMVVLNSGFLSIIIALGSVYWVNMARIVRGQILSLKEREFVLAAITIGASTKRILFRHLLPNTMGVIIVTATMLVPSAIFIEAFLSFIGLGVSAPMASLGTLSSEALASMRTFAYQLFAPAITISIIMFAFNFLGDGLRDALDPKLRN